MTVSKKTYRIDDKTREKISELMKVYNVRSENDLFIMIIDDVYELKKSKAIIPYEEFEKRDLQLQKALLEVGRLQGVLEEKEKQLQKTEQEKQEDGKKGFWARLFGK